LLDLAYIAGSVAFFALMLAYVAGCERLGQSVDNDGLIAEIRP
jgi:hypothetical protein